VSAAYLSSLMKADEAGSADGPAAVSSGTDMSVSISVADLGFEAGLAELRVLRLSVTSSASSSESQS
jgi:hypothetical protein